MKYHRSVIYYRAVAENRQIKFAIDINDVFLWSRRNYARLRDEAYPVYYFTVRNFIKTEISSDNFTRTR